MKQTLLGLLLLFVGSLQSALVRRASKPPESPNGCDPAVPFKCGDGSCIPLRFLCDGQPDCMDFYDEKPELCTAKQRPPLPETIEYLEAFMHMHGPDSLVPLLGEKAKDGLKALHGVENVARLLSECQTVTDFGRDLKMSAAEVEQVRKAFDSIENGDDRLLETMHLRGSAASDLKFFVNKLTESGFLSR